MPDDAAPDFGAFGMGRPRSRSQNRDVTPRNQREGRNGAGASHATMGGALATAAHGAMEMPLTRREREASRLSREVGRGGDWRGR